MNNICKNCRNKNCEYRNKAFYNMTIFAMKTAPQNLQTMRANMRANSENLQNLKI